MVNTEKKPSIGKSIRKGIETVRSFVSTVGDTLHNMRPKTHSKTAIFNTRVKNTNQVKRPLDDIYGPDFGLKPRGARGGKQSGKKTKRNMRKRGTQKRR